MIHHLQILSFEIGAVCNMSLQHAWCPSNDLTRYQDKTTDPMTTAQMLAFLDSMIAHGFQGYVCMHYYCEPTLWPDRCQALADGVHARGLETLLWTNGKLDIPEGIFDRVFQTPYGAEMKGEQVALRPDDRSKIYDTPPTGTGTCFRPAVLEMAVNFYGDLRLCCADWRGTVQIGNIQTDPHAEVLARWENAMNKTFQCGHDVCQRCHALAISPAMITNGYKI